LCVGLGEAARLAKAEMQDDKQHVAKLSKKLLKTLSSIGGIVLNGD